MASLIPNATKKWFLDLAVAESTALKVMLLTSTHSTNIDTMDFIDDVSANEITNTAGSAYTAGGKAIASTATSQDDTDNEGVIDCADVSWTTASFTAHYAVLYDDTGTPSTSRIWAIYDLGGDKIVDGGTFLLTINSEGLINIA